MLKGNLAQTKQSKQILDLKHRLEKFGWLIIEEEERVFKGKPRWEITDKIPNLIFTWVIQRNPAYDPIWLDFIAWYDYETYQTYVNDCAHCQIRGQAIQLDFIKDKGLRVESQFKGWKERLSVFLEELHEIEKK
ncbi:hypothetical protein MHTCC0001_32610 [Flavobacteriaceae bacterium MHTCC 0001]